MTPRIPPHLHIGVGCVVCGDGWRRRRRCEKYDFSMKSMTFSLTFYDIIMTLL